MKQLLWLLFLPYSLSAGFLSWFYTSPNQVTQFECPYHCGDWGTEGVRRVEWKAILAMWELDRFGHAIQDNPFPYHEIPKSMDDPWFLKFKTAGVSLENRIVAKAISNPANNRFYYRDEEKWDGCIEDWDFLHYLDEEENSKGIELKRDFKLYEDSEKFDSYEASYRFDSIKEIQSFCFDIQTTLKDRILDDCNDFWSNNDKGAIAVIETHERIIGNISKKLDENKRLIDRYTESGYSTTKLINEKEGFIKAVENNKRKIEEAKKERESFTATIDRIRASIEIYYPQIDSRLREIKEAYCDILDHCIAHHNTPEAYYHRALYHYSEGLNVNCIEDIKKLFEMTPPEMLTDKIRAKLEFQKGKAECELDLFDDAILTLSSYIKNHPRHKEAYLERAIAHFETGDFHQALQDFAESGFKTNPILPSMIDELEFSTGVVKGLTLSAGESIADFVPSAMSSLSGLSHGIIGFALSPEEVSRDFYHACQNVIEVIKENGLTETLKPFFPEIQELNNSHTLSYSRQGELVGHLVGKFGFEILLIRTGVKGVTAYRDLRKANAVLTLKKISTSAQAEQLITMHAKEWWSKTAPIINELKMAKSAKLDIELFKVFRNQSLSEVQVRRILHHAGFKTFPRPKGIPESWNVSLSKKHGGMVYNHPGNPHIKIRVSPGIPESRNPVQRKPYVIHKTDKGLFDKKGNICKRDSAETHIPLNEYDFRKFSIRETIDE